MIPLSTLWFKEDHKDAFGFLFYHLLFLSSLFLPTSFLSALIVRFNQIQPNQTYKRARENNDETIKLAGISWVQWKQSHDWRYGLKGLGNSYTASTFFAIFLVHLLVVPPPPSSLALLLHSTHFSSHHNQPTLTLGASSTHRYNSNTAAITTPDT